MLILDAGSGWIGPHSKTRLRGNMRVLCKCRAFAKKLNDAPLAIVDKRRSAHNVSEVMNLIGDVNGKVAVLVDDMIDTAGTITNAAKVIIVPNSRVLLSFAESC